MEWFTPECMARIEYYALGSEFSKYAKEEMMGRGWREYQPDGRRREPVFFALTFCTADKVY